MTRGISLANKCLILFGCAIVAILVGALLVPWVGVRTLVHENQIEVAGQVSDAWLAGKIKLGGLRYLRKTELEVGGESDGMQLSWIPAADIDVQAEPDAFISKAMQAFSSDREREWYTLRGQKDERDFVLFARPVTATGLRRLGDPTISDFSAGVSDPSVTDPIRGILVVSRNTQFGDRQLDRSRSVIVLTGLAAGVLAVIVFWLILIRLIFSPVRRLRRIADLVGEGEVDARADIRTGDEFEELSFGFNEMLDRLSQARDRLEQMNESLDLKVSELAEANVGLWESSRFKTEFIANVSHELRTPLNSIIGFAELLQSELNEGESPSAKHVRYLDNIMTSGRSLLEMINELLSMAKIEAGRMEVIAEPTNLSDLLEGITGIMTPQATAKSIDVRIDVEPGMPSIKTDPGKVQQVLYNLLSNAVKFSPDNGTIKIDVQAMETKENRKLIISVSDEGPGIPADMHDVIFEKFRQIDASHTRTHMGTGLGLAICRDLADMLHGELWLESTEGEGATFFLSLNLLYRNKMPKSLMSDQ